MARTLNLHWGLPTSCGSTGQDHPVGNPRSHVSEAPAPHTVYLGVNEIGRRIELSRSTVSRLVKEMHEARFLERKAGNAGLWVARPVRPGPAPALGRHRARRRPDRARRRCRTTSRSAVRSTARRTASRTRSPRRRGTPTSGSSRAIRSRRCATRECGRTHASPRGLSGCPSAGQQRQDLAAEAHRVGAALLE